MIKLSEVLREADAETTYKVFYLLSVSVETLLIRLAILRLRRTAWAQ